MKTLIIAILTILILATYYLVDLTSSSETGLKDQTKQELSADLPRLNTPPSQSTMTVDKQVELIRAKIELNDQILLENLSTSDGFINSILFDFDGNESHQQMVSAYATVLSLSTKHNRRSDYNHLKQASLAYLNCFDYQCIGILSDGEITLSNDTSKKTVQNVLLPKECKTSRGRLEHIFREANASVAGHAVSFSCTVDYKFVEETIVGLYPVSKLPEDAVIKYYRGSEETKNQLIKKLSNLAISQKNTEEQERIKIQNRYQQALNKLQATSKFIRPLLFNREFSANKDNLISMLAESARPPSLEGLLSFNVWGYSADNSYAMKNLAGNYSEKINDIEAVCDNDYCWILISEDVESSLADGCDLYRTLNFECSTLKISKQNDVKLMLLELWDIKLPSFDDSSLLTNSSLVKIEYMSIGQIEHTVFNYFSEKISSVKVVESHPIKLGEITCHYEFCELTVYNGLVGSLKNGKYNSRFQYTPLAKDNCILPDLNNVSFIEGGQNITIKCYLMN